MTVRGDADLLEIVLAGTPVRGLSRLLHSLVEVTMTGRYPSSLSPWEKDRDEAIKAALQKKQGKPLSASKKVDRK